MALGAWFRGGAKGAWTKGAWTEGAGAKGRGLGAGLRAWTEGRDSGGVD